MLRLSTRAFWAVAVLAGLTILTGVAQAAIPNTALVEGALLATGGGPAADGDYAMTFSLLQGADDTVVWSEGPTTVKVASGTFVHALGSVQALSPTLLAGKDALSLRIQIGADPALPKQPLHSTLFAWRAGLSEGLACSGCVTAAHLNAKVIDDLIAGGTLSKVAKSGAFTDLSGGPDLSGYALAAKLATVATSGAYADLLGLPDLNAYAKAATLATVAVSGAYADLEGLPVLAKVDAACGTGLVMKGIQADGTYACVQAMDPTALPKDALDEVSNGLLTNQFNEVAVSTKTPTDVPDNNPVGVSDLIEVPDYGIAQVLTISAEVTNSDTANLRITAIDPGGSKYVLWNKTAKGTSVKTTWPSLTKTVSGDLTTWIGKNPKGKWYLEVVDTAFLNNGTDGALKGWSVNVQVMASAKVGVGGALLLKNAADPPIPCGPTVAGALYFDSKIKAVRYCDGAVWRNLADTCGNGILDATEQCDDGNNTDGDGCSATCQTVCGDGKLLGTEECDDGNVKDGDGCSAACIASTGYTKAKAGTSCLAILNVAKSEGYSPKSGVYWVGENATAAVQLFCDMVFDGGGWTMVAQGCDSNAAATGTIRTDPRAFVASSWKLSDAAINKIRTANTYRILMRGTHGSANNTSRLFQTSTSWDTTTTMSGLSQWNGSSFQGWGACGEDRGPSACGGNGWYFSGDLHTSMSNACSDFRWKYTGGWGNTCLFRTTECNDDAGNGNGAHSTLVR
jgi:cysteine-rich repeat protein